MVRVIMARDEYGHDRLPPWPWPSPNPGKVPSGKSSRSFCGGNDLTPLANDLGFAPCPDKLVDVAIVFHAGMV